MLVPEIPFDLDALCNNMKKNIIKGKVSDIIILAEGRMQRGTQMQDRG